MASNITGIGLRALSAAQLSLTTTQHNIANVNTPGYHRQEAVQAALLPYGTGAGFVGQGANVVTIKRLYAQHLEVQVRTASSQTEFYKAFGDNVAQIDNLLATPETGLSSALQDFFGAVHDLSLDPASMVARSRLLSSAQALTTRFNTLSGQLELLRLGVNQQLSSHAAEITAYARGIADLNERITVAQMTYLQPPNDLLDQRDELVARLNALVETRVVQANDGSYNVYIGNGQALVVGNQAYALATRPSSEDPADVDLYHQIPGGASLRLNPADLIGGSVGGLLAFREQSLNRTQNAIGRIAAALSLSFNQQHALGVDLNGAPGGNFFSIDGTTPVTVLANGNNTGSASMSATLDTANVDKLTGDDYRVIYNGPGSYTVTNLRTQTSLTGDLANPAFAAATLPGLNNIAVSGTPNPGDAFLLQPTRLAARNFSVLVNDPAKIAAAATTPPGDNGNALLLAALQTTPLLDGGRLTLQGAYAQLTGEVGSKAREVEITQQASQNVLAQVKQAQQALSGVNLDEEAANLLRYQQAYQAAAKVIQVSSVLFETLLNLR